MQGAGLSVIERGSDVHVFNWSEDGKYPLSDAKDVWKKYLSCFAENKTLLSEFMPDGKLDT